MVLFDSNRHEFYIVSRDGDLISQHGQEGFGPGEFNELSMAYWASPGNEFLIRDRLLRRYSVFTISGQYLRSISYARDRNVATVHSGFGNRTYLGWHRTFGTEVITARYALLDSNLTEVADLLEITYPTAYQQVGSVYYEMPFARKSGVVPYPDGGFMLYSPSTGRLSLYNSTGDARLHIERAWRTDRVTSEDRRRARNWLVQYNFVQNRETAENINFPERHAAFSKAVTDDRGRIWVERINTPIHSDREAMVEGTLSSYVFDLFGPDGVWLGVHSMDLNPGIYEASYQIHGDYFYYTYQAESSALRFERLHLDPLYPDVAGKRLEK